MEQQQAVVGSWSSRVGVWLPNVQHDGQAFGRDVRSDASPGQLSFPSNWLLTISAEIAKGLPSRYARSMTKGAITLKRISLSDDELDRLADVG
jgi:hypothetical protein